MNNPVLVADTVMNARVISNMVSADDCLYFAANTGGYWKNGVWNSMANGTFLPSSVITNGAIVCMRGNYWARGSSTQGAAYWLDGNLARLNGEYAQAATFFGSDLYIVGTDNDNNIVVWKNGALFETIGSAINLIATSIAIR